MVCAAATFEQGATGGDLPTATTTAAALAAGPPLLDQFLETGLIASKGEGRRHIKAGALKINDTPLREERPLAPDDLVDGQIKLSIGKKKHALVKAAS
ncbi:MAG: hypothetical protein HKN14_13540 [Marinicaulis sp.]|nr:hypothetical protein [Marinicaulis sp.]NNL88248.1 hypothetical protein [Marinicaulis sp.]